MSRHENSRKRINIPKTGIVRFDVIMDEDNLMLGTVEIVGIGERKAILDVKQQGVPVSVIDGKTLAGRGTSISEVINHQTG